MREVTAPPLPSPPSGLASRDDDDWSSVDLEIVIPAYNEAERLPRTLRRTVSFLERQPWSSGITVVDNGSADDTALVPRALRTDRVMLRAIGCSRPGKGAAVRRGIAASAARWVGYIDADLSTPVTTLADTVYHLQRGAAAVVASRHAPGAVLVRPQPVTRRLGGWLFRRLARPLVAGVHDTQCGFKFFQREAVQRALLDCRIDNFAFDVELLGRIQRSGGRIVELPVSWTDDPSSSLRPVGDGLAAFVELLELRRGVSR